MRSSLQFALLMGLLLIGIAGASSILPANTVTNTLYQNTNSTNPLFINIYTTQTSTGYVGANSGNLIQTYDLSSEVVGGVGLSLVINQSAFMVVPPNYYYKLNFSAPSNIIYTYSSEQGAVGAYSFNAPLYVSGNTVFVAYNSISIGLDVNNALDVISMIPLSLLLLVAALAGALISFRQDDNFYRDFGGGIFVVFLLLFAVQTVFDYGAGSIELGIVLLSVAAFIFWMITRFMNLLRLAWEQWQKRK